MRTLPLVMTLTGFGFATTPLAAEALFGAGSVVVGHRSTVWWSWRDP